MDVLINTGPKWLREVAEILHKNLPSGEYKELRLRYANGLVNMHSSAQENWTVIYVNFACQAIDHSVQLARTVGEKEFYWSEFYMACERAKLALRENLDVGPAKLEAIRAGNKAHDHSGSKETRYDIRHLARGQAVTLAAFAASSFLEGSSLAVSKILTVAELSAYSAHLSEKDSLSANIYSSAFLLGVLTNIIND